MTSKTKSWLLPQLTYGLTPFKASSPEDKRRAAAELQCGRIVQLPIDALVVYDLQDESSRTDVKRPFPYLKSIDPQEYAYDYLGNVPLPKIIYRSISDLSEAGLSAWLSKLAKTDAAVFVGAPSVQQQASFKLSDAYSHRARRHPLIPLGGVLIPERHEKSGDEDERVLRKMDRGCCFFVTQAVYSVTASKNTLSDLYYRCQKEERTVPPIIVTLSPCGSTKTLEFLDWLGVSVPKWLKNDLVASRDILETSIELCVDTFQELRDFAKEKGILLGCNVESVSLGKSEIEASVELVHRVRKILDQC